MRSSTSACQLLIFWYEKKEAKKKKTLINYKHCIVYLSSSSPSILPSSPPSRTVLYYSSSFHCLPFYLPGQWRRPAHTRQPSNCFSVVYLFTRPRPTLYAAPTPTEYTSIPFLREKFSPRLLIVRSPTITCLAFSVASILQASKHSPRPHPLRPLHSLNRIDNKSPFCILNTQMVFIDPEETLNPFQLDRSLCIKYGDLQSTHFSPKLFEGGELTQCL